MLSEHRTLKSLFTIVSDPCSIYTIIRRPLCLLNTEPIAERYYTSLLCSEQIELLLQSTSSMRYTCTFQICFYKKDISAFISICKEKPCFHLILNFSTTSPRRHSIGKEEVMNL
jgi:hypothetical protein